MRVALLQKGKGWGAAASALPLTLIHLLLRRGSTASLTQNDLPSTARRAHIGERKGYKDAQNTPEGSQKWAKIDVAERDNAK
jgi:hypothetical protein